MVAMVKVAVVFMVFKTSFIYITKCEYFPLLKYFSKT